MTTQHRKLESLISGHETRNCNVSLITAAVAVAVALPIESNAQSEKLTCKQDSSFPRAPVARITASHDVEYGAVSWATLLEAVRPAMADLTTPPSP